MHVTRKVSSVPVSAPAPEASQNYSYSNLEGQDCARNALAEEVALAIAYNGISQAVMLVSPTDLEDFIVGFSLGSGIIASRDEIYDFTLSGCGSAMQAEVEIASRAFWDLKQQRRQLAGTSGCGLCGVEAVEQALPELNVLPGAPLPPIEWLEGLRQRIGEFQPLGRHCGAVH
ncbi:sulfurtransferase FdhD, partial [Pseudomonas syringae]